MMPIKKQSNIRTNTQMLMNNPVLSQARKKAILTISRRRNIGRNDAKFVNSLAISKNIAKKK